MSYNERERLKKDIVLNAKIKPRRKVAENVKRFGTDVCQTERERVGTDVCQTERELEQTCVRQRERELQQTCVRQRERD
jgi:hypothetical protein